MAGVFTAGLVQFTAARDYAPNLEVLDSLVRVAADKGADLICLPENASLIEPLAEPALAKAFPEDEHPTLATLQALAAELGRWILVGSINVKQRASEGGDGRITNRSLLLDASGGIVARYDKLHTFDVTLSSGEFYRESDTVAAGDKAVLAPTPWGLMGLTICYDVRFPHLYRSLAKAGASFLTVPAAFTKTTGEAHWHLLLRARAIETGCYVLAPAQTGTHAEGRKTFGHSLIVDPWGDVLADGGTEPGVVTAKIDPELVARTRQRIPSLEHDRPFGMPAATSVAGGKTASN